MRRRRRLDLLSRERFLARARIALCVVVASVGGLAIGLFFPLANVTIDNVSGLNVRVFVDDEEWLLIHSGETKERTLACGEHRVTIRAVEGNWVFDAHDIHASTYGPYVLNVLGSQTYFQGIASYGAGNAPPMQIITDKWFAVPAVDYPFQTLPKKLKAPPDGLTVSFITKGSPPKL